ncbi:glycosyl transferase [Flavisolibacter tropicus]|uniref:peptidoglycan glycosyltransferase n=1 Tax=Flavisolibacter tropicus TaxID=1492898 RepID=A0A172U323_9BACT|nr:glycosyl transferase [Flavisolibacter tropicus]
MILFVKRSLIVTVIGFLVFLLLNWIFPLPDKIDYSTIVTDDKGELINAFLTKDDKWRMKTELNEISPLLKKTIIQKEDQYFYYHPGINIMAISRAAFNNLVKGQRTSGASTITMQVARALEQRPRTIGAKLIETYRAFQLEWKYSKDEILQLYLNLVPYGSNIEGVKSASLLYFKKNPDHLSLAEITALSIIPNRPSSLVIGKNNDLIIKERNKWLHRFAASDVFTQKEIEDALAEPLQATRNVVPHFAPHLSYKLNQQSSDHTIHTTINLNKQLKIEKLTEDYIRTLRLNNIRNAAVIVVDNKTHNVISYVGSAGFFDTTDGGQVNGAAAIRQPGSTLKPLLYGLCMDEGFITPKSVLNDVPINYNGYAPENYDQKFNGFVTTEYALEQSLNIPAVKSLKQLGKEKLISKLIAADFTQVAKDQNKLGLSLILGGCGTSLEQLTGLFASFANNGTYAPISFIQNTKPVKKVQLLSPSANYLITGILSKINRPDFPLNWQATEHMPKIAWKTGTSYGRKDAWSIGFNKQYTVGVWVGNFSGAGAPELSGANTATPLLFKIFNTIDYANNGDWFTPPAALDIRQVCTETGLPPGPNCTNLILDHFIPLISTTATCQHVQEIKVAPDESISYCTTCAPQEGYIKKLYRVVAPEMQDYFHQNNIAFKAIPPHNPACEKVFKGEGPIITSPTNGSEYYINQNDPEPLQLTANTANDVNKVYWYINDEFYKAAAAGDKPFFVPTEGPVKISCTDDKGRTRNILIRVKYVKL